MSYFMPPLIAVFLLAAALFADDDGTIGVRVVIFVVGIVVGILALARWRVIDIPGL
jgi:presenilin-like A22 family membrane protease